MTLTSEAAPFARANLFKTGHHLFDPSRRRVQGAALSISYQLRRARCRRGAHAEPSLLRRPYVARPQFEPRLRIETAVPQSEGSADVAPDDLAELAGAVT